MIMIGPMSRVDIKLAQFSVVSELFAQERSLMPSLPIINVKNLSVDNTV